MSFSKLNTMMDIDNIDVLLARIIHLQIYKINKKMQLIIYVVYYMILPYNSLFIKRI